MNFNLDRSLQKSSQAAGGVTKPVGDGESFSRRSRNPNITAHVHRSAFARVRSPSSSSTPKQRMMSSPSQSDLPSDAELVELLQTTVVELKSTARHPLAQAKGEGDCCAQTDTSILRPSATPLHLASVCLPTFLSAFCSSSLSPPFLSLVAPCYFPLANNNTHTTYTQPSKTVCARTSCRPGRR